MGNSQTEVETNMRAELQKAGEEIDKSKLGRAVKQTDAQETTDEVSGRAAPVYYPCPHCNTPMQLQMDYNPQWFQCPNCGYFFEIFA